MSIEYGVRKILAAGALPVVMGGDHSINIPCINAFEGQEPFHIVHIDAHLDFVDERHGVRYGHGNPLRRAAEKCDTWRVEIGSPILSGDENQRPTDAPRSPRVFEQLRLEDVDFPPCTF